MRHSKNRDRSFFRDLCQRFLIVTDGVVTERGYFERVKYLTRDSIRIVARSSKDIDELVNIALAMKSNSDYDFVAVVCDIDQRLQNNKTRETLERAIKLAEQNQIIICLSHESFEVWLLAHFGNVSSRAKERNQAQEMALKKGIVRGRDGKVVVGEIITKGSILVALKEVERMRKVYGSDILSSAPMTDVDMIVKKIRLTP